VDVPRVEVAAARRDVTRVACLQLSAGVARGRPGGRLLSPAWVAPPHERRRRTRIDEDHLQLSRPRGERGAQLHRQRVGRHSVALRQHGRGTAARVQEVGGGGPPVGQLEYDRVAAVEELEGERALAYAANV
jgi:hypothetical protein